MGGEILSWMVIGILLAQFVSDIVENEARWGHYSNRLNGYLD
jgi:hypothetical protein